MSFDDFSRQMDERHDQTLTRFERQGRAMFRAWLLVVFLFIVGTPVVIGATLWAVLWCLREFGVITT